jgi:hypothetical protein
MSGCVSEAILDAIQERAPQVAQQCAFALRLERSQVEQRL